MTQVFDRPHEAARHIAPAVVAILESYPDASKGHKDYLKTCLKWIIREMPVYPTMASKAALAKAKALGCPSLLGLKWVDQLKFDPGRKELHWEHVVPVGDIRARLLELSPPTIEKVCAVLETYMVAWITKTEDATLKRTARVDPLEEYRNKGIELIDLRDNA